MRCRLLLPTFTVYVSLFVTRRGHSVQPLPNHFEVLLLLLLLLLLLVKKRVSRKDEINIKTTRKKEITNNFALEFYEFFV